MRVIETGSLTLEPQTAAHAEEMFAVLSDPAIYEYENQPPPSLEMVACAVYEARIKALANGREQWLNWVVRLRLPSSSVTFKQRCIPTTAQPSPTSCPALTGVAGLARQAVEAMISELVEHYRVHGLSSVLKRENLRSMRLLERLGFSLASPEQHMKHQVGPGELLMVRKIQRI